MGRPRVLDRNVGDQIIDMMGRGYSLTATCGELGIYRQRVYEWAEEDQDLADALKMGKQKRVLKLEADLLSAESGPEVTSRIFALKNAAPEEWRDKVTQEHTGPNEGPIQTEEKGEASARLTTLVTSIAERLGNSGDTAGE